MAGDWLDGFNVDQDELAGFKIHYAAQYGIARVPRQEHATLGLTKTEARILEARFRLLLEVAEIAEEDHGGPGDVACEPNG